MEHRWGARIPLDMPVRVIQQPFQDKSARFTDVSLSGAMIATALAPRPLSLVSILLDRRTAIEAFVTRRYEGCIGVEWSEYKPLPIVNLLTTLTEPGCTLLRWPDLRIEEGGSKTPPTARFKRTA